MAFSTLEKILWFSVCSSTFSRQAKKRFDDNSDNRYGFWNKDCMDDGKEMQAQSCGDPLYKIYLLRASISLDLPFRETTIACHNIVLYFIVREIEN